MALRDKLRERSQPYLDQDEEIRSVFMAQDKSQWMILLFYWLFLWTNFLVVVATDRAILLLKTRWIPSIPSSLYARLPRPVQVEQSEGMIFDKIDLAGNRLAVQRRFRDEVRTAIS